MAKLDGEELKKFNKLLDELNKKKDKLGQDKLLNLDGTVENLDVVNQLLDVANENLADLNQSVEGIRETWSSVVGELKKVDNLTGVSVKSFNKLSNIANQLSNSQKGLNELSSRQITSLITKTKIEAENLKFQEKQLLAKGRSNDLAQKALDALNSSIEINQEGFNNIIN
jgi:prophage DNA circulation protein